MTQSKHLYLIDGSGFIFRAYHSLPPLTRPDGTPVGAVYGFLNMMIKLMEGVQTDYIAVVFDKARVTFRNRMYDQYKANRPEAPADLIPQFPLMRDATEALNICCLEQDDYEADDVIASYTMLGLKQGMDVTIVSSDKDLMQLIQPGVTMFDPMKLKPIGEKEVLEKFGVPPDKVTDVLALIGDSSDNVPGVPGIGPKTAAELIHQFGSLEGILAHTSEIKQAKRRETLEQNIDKARLSHQLVKLCLDCPLPAPLEALALRQPDPQKLLSFLQAQQFKSLMIRMANKFGMEETLAAAAEPRDVLEQHYTLVQDEATLQKWIDAAIVAGKVAFDTETTSLYAHEAELVGFSLSSKPGYACYVPVGHVEEGLGNEDSGIKADIPQTDLFAAPAPKKKLVAGQIPLQRALDMLRPLMADPSVVKIGQNIKYDMQVLRKYGIEVTPIDDTMLMSYALHAGQHNHGMDELADKYLRHKTIKYTDVTGTGKSQISFEEVALDAAMRYAAEDADITLRLEEHFRPELVQAHVLTVYETIDKALIPVLAAMEAKGVKVDTTILQRMSKDFGERMAIIEQQIHKLAGQEFNVGSPKQLGEILFDAMGLPGGKKSSKTGAYNTGAEVLEELAEAGHELPKQVLEWRQLSKLKSTYTDSLANQIDPRTGRVHTCYMMAVASTGRLSSTEPNLQNIPIRTEEGKAIRTAFVAEPGHKLLSADYSQIELRLLAHMANIDALKAAFQHGDDIHAITASQIFGVAPGEVNSDLRRKAKTINFGIIYGMSAHGLATRLGISRSEAGAYINAYFQQYPGIKEYMERCKEFARAHGYVLSLYGRRCHVPGILEKNPGMRSFSERAAINAPLQGTAADIIKRAMIRIQRELEDKKLQTAMLLQVHDELVFEIPEAEVEMAVPLIKKTMEQAANLDVPLVAETGIGQHWGEIH